MNSAFVDPTKCEGSGLCVRLLPRLFSMGPDDVAVIAQDALATTSDELLNNAAVLCPFGAIIVDSPE